MNTCIYVEWYKFKVCEIKTCKNHSNITPTRCMAIDRRQPSGNKVISDAELHYYKFEPSVSTRLVSYQRKTCVERVKKILVLYEFIQYLNKNHKGIQYEHKRFTYLQNRYPLKVKKLGFKPWMWEFMTTEVFNSFLETKEGECEKFTLYQLLNLSESKFFKLQIIIEKLYASQSN